MPNHRAPAVALIAVLLVGACARAAPSSDATTGPGTTPTATAVAGSPAPGATREPIGSASPSATDAGTPTGEPTPTEEPAATDAPTEPAETPAETELRSAIPGGAAACSGTDGNRDFFAGFAPKVDWPVLCGVLPKGWFVSQGKYGTGGGGWMYIEYNGPGTSTLGLYEGTYCATKGGCDVGGSSLGPATLGPLEAELYQTAEGYAIVVAAGESPSWFMTTTGLDQATTVRLARRVAEVGA